MNLKELESLAAVNKIAVHYVDNSNRIVKSFIVNLNGDYHIIDSSATLEEQTKMLAHELSHYFTDTLSEVGTDDRTILNNEKIANEYMRKELIKNEK